jgi:hypothetical protein
MTARVLILGGLAVLAACQAQPGEPVTDDDGPTIGATAGATEWCDITAFHEPVGECARFQQQIDALDAGVDAFQPAERMVADEVNVVTYAITRLPDAVQGEDGELAEAVPEDTAPVADAPGSAEAGPPSPTPTGPTQDEIDTALAQATEAVTDIVATEGEEGTVTTDRVKMSRFMYACLKGPPSFVIEPAACQSLDTLEQPDAVWHWEVTPTEPGKDFELQLISGFEVRASDGSTRHIGNPVRKAEIEVKVTALGRAKRIFAAAEDWLRSPLGVIAALTALLAAFAGLRRAFRSARGKPPEEPGKAGDQRDKPGGGPAPAPSAKPAEEQRAPDKPGTP